MIPVLFKKDEQQFRTYGLGELSDFIDTPEVKRERNGQYTFYMKYSSDGVLADKLEEGLKIKSDAGARTKWQTFEINRVIRKTGQPIEVFAKHISMRTAKDVLNPRVRGNSLNGQQLLQLWRNNLVGDDHWEVWSDITAQVNVDWSIEDYSNAQEVLGGREGSILDRIGGEYEFDNRTIRLWRQMGRTAPTVLEYGRNIISIEKDNQEDSVYTSVYPFATYTPEGRDTVEMVTLPEIYIDSDYIEMYDHRKVQLVDFTTEFDYDNPPTVARLRNLTTQYIENNEVGSPWENIKVEYQDLSKTLDYQDFKVMEEVELNDVVPVYYPQFNIMNNNAKVVVMVYDPVKEEYKHIELGVIGQRFKSVMTGDLTDRLNKVEKEQKQQHTYIVNAAGNRIWYSTPLENMEHKVGDTWFEENGQYTRIRVWNGSQWIVEIDNEDVAKVEAEIIKAQEDIQDAKDSADAANQQINDAIQNAGFTTLNDLTSNLRSMSESTQQDAADALQNSLDAISQTGGLEKSIADINLDLDETKGSLNITANRLTMLEEDFDFVQSEWTQTFDSFQSTVSNIDGRVSQQRQDLDGLTTSIGNAEDQLTTIQSTVSGIQSTVANKASQTEVTQLANGFNVLVQDFNNLEIGGRNLVPNSREESSFTNTIYNHPLDSELMAEYIGETLTISFFAEAETEGQIMDVYLRNASAGTIISGARLMPFEVSTEYTRYVYTIVLVDITKVPNLTLAFRSTSSAGGSVRDEVSVRKIQIEKGNKATDWTPAPEDMASQAQLSVLEDNINLRVVSKGEVLTQINLEADRALIQSKRLYLDTQTVVFSGNAFIPSANIVSVNADKITAGTLDAATVNIINLNVNRLAGNISEFVRSGWNSAAGGSVSISGSGISSHASDNSQVYIQNGIMGVRNPSGATLGHIGYHSETSRAFYHIETSLGTNFAISARIGNSSSSVRRTMLDIFPGSSETYIRTNDFRHVGATGDSTLPTARFSGSVRVDDELRLSGGNIVNPYGVYFDNGGSIYTLSNGTMRYDLTGIMQFRIGTVQKMRIDSTRNYMNQILNMQGHEIVSSPSISDERLKNVYGLREENDLEKLMKIDYVNFTWKDSERGGNDLGFVAQQVQTIVPEIIMKSSNGHLGFNPNSYINLIGHAVQQLTKEHENTLSVASHAYLLAEQHEDELEVFKRKIKELEEKVERLEGAA